MIVIMQLMVYMGILKLIEFVFKHVLLLLWLLLGIILQVFVLINALVQINLEIPCILTEDVCLYVLKAHIPIYLLIFVLMFVPKHIMEILLQPQDKENAYKAVQILIGHNLFRTFVDINVE